MQFRFVNPKWKLNHRPSRTPFGSATLKGSPMSQLAFIWNPNFTSPDFHGLGGLTSQTKSRTQDVGIDGNSAKNVEDFPTVWENVWENQLKFLRFGSISNKMLEHLGSISKDVFCGPSMFPTNSNRANVWFVSACALWNTTVGRLMDLEGSQNTR